MLAKLADGSLTQEQFDKFAVVTATRRSADEKSYPSNYFDWWGGSQLTDALFDKLRKQKTDQGINLADATAEIPRNVTPFNLNAPLAGLGINNSQHPDSIGTDVNIFDPMGVGKHRLVAGLPVSVETSRASRPGRSGAGRDSNEKESSGAGDQGYVRADQPIAYTVHFENIAPPGIPAEFIFPPQCVTVSDQQTGGSGAGAIASAAVPEPATLVLLMLAAAGWCLRRGRTA